MELLIISHACALPQNQRLFAMAASARGWKVTMVIPDGWRNEYGDRMETKLLEGFDADMIAPKVLRNGSVPLHFYRTSANRIIKSVDPDVVYCHNEPYALSTIQWCHAAKRRHKPFGYFSCQNLVKKYPPPFAQAERWVYRSSRFAFPITESVDRVHRTKGYVNLSTIVPLGFDPGQYHSKSDVRARHEGQDSDVNLVFIGRFVEEKGLVTLAQALGRIRDLDWRLNMIGAGPFESVVRAAFAENGVSDRVSWRGFVPHAEVANLYESMDCLLLPSETRPNWKEQFGRVLVESMACGTPVVGSDSGEIPIIIAKTGGGLSFREADPEACADALRKMISDRKARCEMAVAGHCYVHKHYALPSLADDFAKAIEGISNGV